MRSRSIDLASATVAERDTEDLEGFPHGMPTTQAETINADLPAFMQS